MENGKGLAPIINGAVLTNKIRLDEGYIAYIKQVTSHPDIDAKTTYPQCMWYACQDKMREDLLKVVGNANM